ncbi:oxygenase MpaB family protein [Patulibacter defluvii]|uniref:oxygenase MpaB family protein n=1 Tax=Patulibacter defluvii TaxID=3095358 RepID=UPI002A7506DF|nr:oxygenase MpaB family protein [Patulibacter sp. DM4]
MAPSVLPPPEEAAALVPSRRGVTWRYGSDLRMVGSSVYVLLLQVAHPTVGAGVHEHSAFELDPWGRLHRTLDFVSTMVYGGPEAAAEMGRRVRAMHRGIRGVDEQGRRYNALEPEAYAWVQLTLAEGMIGGHRALGRRLRPAQRDQLWQEWRRVGRLLGVRERDLPDSWEQAEALRDRTIAERLEHTPAVDQVLRLVLAPPAPPLPGLPGWLWRIVSAPAARIGLLITGGLLGPVLRERFGLPWNRRRQAMFRLLAGLSRLATPVFWLLPPLRIFGPTYLRIRRGITRRPAVERVAVDLPPRVPE